MSFNVPNIQIENTGLFNNIENDFFNYNNLRQEVGISDKLAKHLGRNNPETPATFIEKITSEIETGTAAINIEALQFAKALTSSASPYKDIPEEIVRAFRQAETDLMVQTINAYPNAYRGLNHNNDSFSYSKSSDFSEDNPAPLPAELTAKCGLSNKFDCSAEGSTERYRQDLDKGTEFIKQNNITESIIKTYIPGAN
jgi:hypothetical protein